MKCNCGHIMEVIARSETKANGKRIVVYRCPYCGTVIKVCE